MQLTGITLPGYRAYEYLLVLEPHEELRGRIMQLKNEFADKYKVYSPGKPYLTLANFVQYEMMEERLLSRLRVVAMGHTPFKIEMKGFGSFPAHTIYVNVTSKLPVQGLVKEVRRQAQKLMKLNKENKPHFIMEPHITIARKLQPWQYEKGWLEYSNRHFSGRFIADSMLLLRRPAGEMKYLPVERFHLQNMPVATKQGELF